ncbi:MAG: siderophore-interacting protein [Micropruina sp.]|uniref:siderophore-interacting protein n=1 Tax=Micropruina sp. TaxID=2737536 RepID=UPI0039E32523
MSSPETVVATATVVSTEVLSPHFIRIELGGEELADFGVDGPYLDQRIKLIFPPPGGTLPDLRAAGDNWYSVLAELPEGEQCHIRVYSVREVRGEGRDKRLLVDFVLHLEPGATGPAASWAAAAKPADNLIVVGPRIGADWGGIEYAPGADDRVVLAGDETAVPAISRILGDIADDVRGHVFLEVPVSADILDIAAPASILVSWLPRDGAGHGERLIPAVLDHLGTQQHQSVPDDEVDPDLWETSTYSSSEDDLDAPSAGGIPGVYVWIAGESKVVTTLRRHLVNDLGIDRSQVAFMGYWRRGVSMRG